MFTPSIISKEDLPNGNKKVGVQFIDGGTTLPVEYVTAANSEGLENFIKGRQSSVNFVPPAVGAYVPPSTIPPTLTQAEIDFNNFQKWFYLLVAMDAAKSLGAITGNEAVVVAAINKVKALAVANIPKMFL